MRNPPSFDDYLAPERLARIACLLPCLLTLVLSCQAIASTEPDTNFDSSFESTRGENDNNSAVDAGKTNADVFQAGNTDPAKNKTISSAPVAQYISTLLIDKEMPILGGKWAGDIFVDFPLNAEPTDAAITLRRAKLKYSHSFGKHWQLKLSASYYKGSGLEADDSYLVYSGWQTALMTFGINDAPYSLESLSSSAGLTFMERGLAVSALSGKKGGGITFLKRTPNSILNGALTLTSPSQDNKRQPGQAAIFHYVYSPISLAGRSDIHLGGSFSYRLNSSGNHTEFSTRPEIGVTQDYFVDTGTIENANKTILAGLEASRVYGRFSWQTELLTARVQRDASPDVFFWGAYAYVSWFLTNDSRNYNAGLGEYDPLVPRSPLFKGGRGAFELAFRASYIDLTDKDVIGGEESNLTLGFNWYLNDNFRLMTNLVKVLDVKRPGSEFNGENPLIFALRFQWLLN